MLLQLNFDPIILSFEKLLSRICALVLQHLRKPFDTLPINGCAKVQQIVIKTMKNIYSLFFLKEKE